MKPPDQTHELFLPLFFTPLDRARARKRKRERFGFGTVHILSSLFPFPLTRDNAGAKGPRPRPGCLLSLNKPLRSMDLSLTDLALARALLSLSLRRRQQQPLQQQHPPSSSISLLRPTTSRDQKPLSFLHKQAMQGVILVVAVVVVVVGSDLTHTAVFQ